MKAPWFVCTLAGALAAVAITACGQDESSAPAVPSSQQPPRTSAQAPSAPPDASTSVKPSESAGVTRFVNSAHPAARDSGAGTAAEPYRTLSYAMKQLRPGDTLNIAGGVYRDALVFPEVSWSGAATVIQATGAAEVTIKGSDVVSGWASVKSGVFVKRSWTVNSQQVLVDGVALKQIGGTIFGGYPDKPNHALKSLLASQGGIWPGRTPGGVTQLTDNSFYYDADAQALYIKVPLASLDGHLVEVSVRPYLISGQKLQNVALRNLHLRHANTTALSQSGAVALSGNRLVLDRIDVAQADGAGFDITGDDNVIQNSRANDCGQVGMKVRGHRNRLIDNETNYNNTRGFNKSWEAGGAKFVGNGGLIDSEVTGHRALGNRGDGIWFDWLNNNNQIHGNVAAYNTGFGIHYEASQKGYIYDNYVFANGQRGIYLPHSPDSVIAHNLVVKNGLEGIAIIDEGRSPDRPELRPRSDRVFGNIIAWNGRAIVLPQGLLGCTSNYNLILTGSAQPGFAAGWGSPAKPAVKTLAEWRTASGEDSDSWSESLEAPPALLAALDAKQPDPDWSSLKAIASRYKVPSEPASSAASLAAAMQSSPPGPRE